MATVNKTQKPKVESTAKQMADKLLDLHVRHEMALFDTKAFITWVQEELNLQLVSARTLRLDQIVSAEQVKAVISRNVVEHDVPGAIAEIAGEAATHLFTSTQHKKTLLKEVISSTQFEEFIDKLLELPEQRRNGIDHVIDLPIYRDLISGVLYQAIIRYVYDANVLSKNVPGVSSMLKFGKRMIDKTAPKLEGAVEDSVRAYISDNLSFLLHESKEFLENSLTEEDIKASAMELWDTLENKSMNDFQQGMDSIDLSEFVVLGYEFWLSFRTTDYFKNCYELIVDYFYDKYGSANLGLLLDDLLITPERIMTEVSAFAPDALAALKANGQLESFLRRRLETFYSSDAARDCLTRLEA